MVFTFITLILLINNFFVNVYFNFTSFDSDKLFSSLFYEKVQIVGGFEEKVGKSRIKTKK